MSIRERRVLKYHDSNNHSSYNQEQKNNVYNQTIIMHSPQFNINNAFIPDSNNIQPHPPHHNNNNNNSNYNTSNNNYYQINQNTNIGNMNNQNLVNTPSQNYDKQQFSRNDSKNDSSQGKVYINRKLSHDRQLMNFFPPNNNNNNNNKTNQTTINYDGNNNEGDFQINQPISRQYATITNNTNNVKDYHHSINTIQYHSIQPPSDNNSNNKTKGKQSFRKASVKRPQINSTGLNYQPQIPLYPHPPPQPQSQSQPQQAVQALIGHVPLTKLIPSQPNNNLNDSTIDFQTTFVVPENPQNLQHIFFLQNGENNGSKQNVEKKSKERLDKSSQLISIYGNRNTQKKSLNSIPILNQSGQLQNYYIPSDQRVSKSTGRHQSVIRRRQREEGNNLSMNQINSNQTIQHPRNQQIHINNFRSISNERQSFYTNLRQQNSRGYFESLKPGGLQSSGERQKINFTKGIKSVQGNSPLVYSLQNNLIYSSNQDGQNYTNKYNNNNISENNNSSKQINLQTIQQNNINNNQQENVIPIQYIQQIKKNKKIDINSLQNSAKQLNVQKQNSQPQRARSFGRTRAYRFPQNNQEQGEIKQNQLQQLVLKDQGNKLAIEQNDINDNLNNSSKQSDYLEKYIKNVLQHENMSTSNYDRLSSHMDKLSQKIFTYQSDIKDFNLVNQPIESPHINSDLVKQNNSEQINRFSFDQNYDPNRSFNDLPSAMEERRDEENGNDKYKIDDFEQEEILEEKQDIQFGVQTSEQMKRINDSKVDSQKTNNNNIYRLSYDIQEDSSLIRAQNIQQNNQQNSQYQSNYSSIKSFGCQNSYVIENSNNSNNINNNNITKAYATINQDQCEYNNDNFEVIEESFGSTFINKKQFTPQTLQNNQSDENIKLVDESIQQTLNLIQSKQPKEIPHPPYLDNHALRTQDSQSDEIKNQVFVKLPEQKKQKLTHQVTFCESPIIMEPKQQPLVVPDEKKFKRNAAKIYKRNDLLNKETLKDSNDQFDIEKLNKIKINLQFQEGDKRTLIPKQPPQKKEGKFIKQIELQINENTDIKQDENKMSINDQDSDLNPVDELNTYKEERNQFDDNDEESGKITKQRINSQFDQMIITSLNNYLNKTETDQDLKIKSDGYFSQFHN